MKTLKPMPVPSFFDAKRRNDIYIPDRAAIMEEALETKRRFKVLPSTARPKIARFKIDWQIGFGEFAGATLPVRGSCASAVRSATLDYEWGYLFNTYQNTYDTHYAWQLFHPLFLVDKDGKSPTPGVPIPDADIQSGKWEVRKEAANAWFNNPSAYPWIAAYMRHYSRELAASTNKYPFIPWPFHRTLGCVDHALFPLIYEATLYWEVLAAHNHQPWLKGDGMGEAYSPCGPEVKTDHEGRVRAQLNPAFLNTLKASVALIADGQAKSHCFASFAGDLRDQILKEDPSLASRVYLVEDCSDPVFIPNGLGPGKDLDFTPQANAAMDACRNAGMHVVKSTTPLTEWPGMDKVLGL